MKRALPWIIFALAGLWVASNFRMPQAVPGDFDLVTFAKLPVVAEGRGKPFDTVARNALLILRGKQSLVVEEGRTIQASRWLADVLFNSTVADTYPAFVIHNPEVLGLFAWEQSNRKYFSYNELYPFIGEIDTQGKQAEALASPHRTPYQTAIYNLRNAILLYHRLKNSLRPGGKLDFSSEIASALASLPSARAAMAAGQRDVPEPLTALARTTVRFEAMAKVAYLLPVPKDPSLSESPDEWQSIGSSLLRSLATGTLNPVTKTYALLGDSYQAPLPDSFNQQVHDLSEWMAQKEPQATARASYEFLFNQVSPFYQAMVLYVLGFLLVCVSWLAGDRRFAFAACALLILALALHTFGLGSRMYLQGRPPVTNLYSSAVFIGWGAVVIGLVIEKIFRDGVGLACSAVIGFLTLIIAHHLAGSGDTLEMLQAVLDTNIWLATHVVTITLGYSAMFLAGALAHIYIIRGFFTRSLTRESAQSLARMTCGVVCFATFFSFVGTVLGGIWADQSWGRFWGWDPKENGALLIVIWCAIILHARLAGYIRARGLMVLVLFGNVITSFSWFGVNMLGVGLHSYGFMNKALPWLLGFMASQLALMALAALPLQQWRSFQGDKKQTPSH
jgi:ABC-type transport system involved in cytochrome c biogenesis permease subunit